MLLSPIAAPTILTFVCLLPVSWRQSLMYWISTRKSKYFSTAPQDVKWLEFVVSTQGNINAERRKVLIGMCKTRWSERDIAYENFYLALPFIVQALEIIVGTHATLRDMDNKYTEGWDASTKREATSYLKAVTNFQFITYWDHSKTSRSNSRFCVRLQSSTIQHWRFEREG